MARTGPRPTSGFVYIITNPAFPGYVKVGRAKSLNGRLADYQTATPFRDFKLHFAAHFPDHAAAENAFKRRMRGFRVKGTEWWTLHPDDARGVLVSIQEASV